MNELTIEDRKRLTELLSECWHDPVDPNYPCTICGVAYVSNRTFTTPDDMVALKDKLVEKGDWCEFDEWAYMQWDSLKPFNDLSRHLGEQSDWLINAPRFCWLVSEWTKK